MRQCLTVLAFLVHPAPAPAHHSMLLYDTQRLEHIEGTISKAFFGRPHSRFEVTVVIEGQTQHWTMIAQDPEDARRFGYFEELGRLAVGTTVEIAGWPHRNKPNELLGHWLRSQDSGYVELIPESGYARPPLYAAMDRAVVDKRVLDVVVADVADEATAARIARWVRNDHPIARAGAEVQRERARLIAVTTGDERDYVGMPGYLACQAEIRPGIELPSMAIDQWPSTIQQRFVPWVSTYNRVLAKHWELTLSSCGN